MTRLAAASTGERIEVSARGQRISIIEAANVPTEAADSNVRRTIAMGVAAGLGIAGGLFALLEFLNRSVRRPAEIIGPLGITPLAPQVLDPRSRAQAEARVAAAQAALQAAEKIAATGAKVEIMTRDRVFASEVMGMSLTPAMRALQKYDVTFTVTWTMAVSHGANAGGVLTCTDQPRLDCAVRAKVSVLLPTFLIVCW